MGARFSAPVQAGPGAHPASYTLSTGSFLGVKRTRRGVNHPPPSSVEVKVSVELYYYLPSGRSWPRLGRSLPLHTHTHIYICCFNTSGHIFRLPHSIALDYSIHPILHLFYSWLNISHLFRFFGDGLAFSFLQVSS